MDLSTGAIEKARVRIGRGSWDYMAWFVKLANADVGALSEGDALNLLEECQVMRSVHFPFRPMEPDRKRYPFSRGGLHPGTPTVDQLKHIHTAVRECLAAIADGDEVTLGPFEINHTVCFRRATELEKSGGFRNHLIFPAEVLKASRIEYAEKELLIRLGRLLESEYIGEPLVERVRRCPHCQRLFLQFRSNANYCGRLCHSRAGMRKLRADRKAKRRKSGKRLT